MNQIEKEKIHYTKMPLDVQITIRELVDSGVTCDRAYKVVKKYVQEDAHPKSQLVIDYVSCPLAMNWIKEHPISFLKGWEYVVKNS